MWAPFYYWGLIHCWMKVLAMDRHNWDLNLPLSPAEFDEDLDPENASVFTGDMNQPPGYGSEAYVMTGSSHQTSGSQSSNAPPIKLSHFKLEDDQVRVSARYMKSCTPFSKREAKTRPSEQYISAWKEMVRSNIGTYPPHDDRLIIALAGTLTSNRDKEGNCRWLAERLYHFRDLLGRLPAKAGWDIRCKEFGGHLKAYPTSFKPKDAKVKQSGKLAFEQGTSLLDEMFSGSFDWNAEIKRLAEEDSSAQSSSSQQQPIRIGTGNWRNVPELTRFNIVAIFMQLVNIINLYGPARSPDRHYYERAWNFIIYYVARFTMITQSTDPAQLSQEFQLQDESSSSFECLQHIRARLEANTSDLQDTQQIALYFLRLWAKAEGGDMEQLLKDPVVISDSRGTTTKDYLRGGLSGFLNFAIVYEKVKDMFTYNYADYPSK